MSLCGPANLTLIIKILEMKGIIDIEGENKITGTYGDIIDELLSPGNGQPRQCRIIGSYEFGRQLPNGSFTGALALLKNKQGDMYLNPGTQYFYKDFLEQSQVVLSDRYMVGQRISESIKSKETIDMLTVLNLDKNVKLFAVTLSFIFLIILILLAYLSSSRIMISKLLENFFHFRSDYVYPASSIGLSLVFFQLFSMIFKLMISSQINTSKIVVDTSYIINSMEKLLEDKSMVCWIKNDIEIRMAEQSPKGSQMKRLYEEKKYDTPVRDMDNELSHRCLLSLQHVGQEFDFTNRVLFINEPSLYAFIASFVAPNPYVSYWISSPLMEMLSVYYYRKGLTDYQKQQIDTSNTWKYQSGLSQKSYDNVLAATTKLLSGTMVYTNIKQYIMDNTIFTNLIFSFYSRIIIIFSILYPTIACIFAINCIMSKKRKFLKGF